MAGKKREVPRICSIDGCSEKHYAKGYCRIHYREAKEHGCVRKENDICSVEGCDKPSITKKGLCYCKAHYRRYSYGIDMLAPFRLKNDGNCLIDGCERECFAKGYCRIHYQRIMKHGENANLTLEKLKSINERNSGKICIECGKPYYAKGLCKKHYMESKGYNRYISKIERMKRNGE